MPAEGQQPLLQLRWVGAAPCMAAACAACAGGGAGCDELREALASEDDVPPSGFSGAAPSVDCIMSKVLIVGATWGTTLFARPPVAADGSAMAAGCGWSGETWPRNPLSKSFMSREASPSCDPSEVRDIAPSSRAGRREAKGALNVAAA